MSRVLVIFAEGSEELESVTLVNILRRGGIEVTLAGLSDAPLRGSRGTQILPDGTLDAALAHDYDMVILPGGMPGTTHLRNDARVIALVQQMAQAGKWVAAICAAPSVLAAAGLLDEKRATCYPGSLKEFPKVFVQDGAIVQDGFLLTSRGPGTAMDFALYLLELLAGNQTRRQVEIGLVR
ncbi:MAG: DJ-1/PfpI family protein [Gallionella sp.]|nr:DJ-1/PfpI family protein [Gallionella sp.]